MFRVVVGEALGCVFLHSYMKSYSGPIRGEVFFSAHRHMHAASPKEYCHTRSLRLCRVLFSFFGRGAAASARQSCSNGQHVTRQSDHFSVRKREFASHPGRHPGVPFVGAAICVFVGLSRADLVFCRALSFFFFFFQPARRVSEPQESRCLVIFAWIKISLHGQMRGLPLTVRQIKVCCSRFSANAFKLASRGDKIKYQNNF